MATKKKKQVSPCIRCSFQNVERKQHEIELAMIVGRIAQLQAELQRVRLLVPPKKEKYAVACQTEVLEPEDLDTGTGTGTQIDDQVDTDVEDRTVEEYPVEIVYRIHGDDVLLEVADLHSHFMGATHNEELYVEDGILSLHKVQEACHRLPFPYDEEEVRQQGHLFFLLQCMEERTPFTRTLTVIHEYGTMKKWIVERRYHFQFVRIN
jgi:hypothetical protein